MSAERKIGNIETSVRILTATGAAVLGGGGAVVASSMLENALHQTPVAYGAEPVKDCSTGVKALLPNERTAMIVVEDQAGKELARYNVTGWDRFPVQASSTVENGKKVFKGKVFNDARPDVKLDINTACGTRAIVDFGGLNDKAAEAAYNKKIGNPSGQNDLILWVVGGIIFVSVATLVFLRIRRGNGGNQPNPQNGNNPGNNNPGNAPANNP